MSDAVGIEQFLNTLAEMAQGARQPSILPVWCRELLSARNPPCITCNHREYEEVIDTKEGTIVSYEDDMVQQSFFFGSAEIAALHRLVPHRLGECTRFELITACLWHCHTKALQLKPGEDVCMMCLVNARARFNPPIPVGYYGNAVVYPAVVTTAGKLCGNPFGYAVELTRKIKANVTEEYVHSMADLMAIKGRPLFTAVRSCIVSDVTRARIREVDFGWGNAVFGVPAKAGAGAFLGVTFLIPCENAKGEEGIIFPIYLPAKAMKRFAKELGDILGIQNQPTKSGQYPTFIKSTL